jgi:D-alanyl-D-alanine carboxypeptidase (penicillin-binding protein 5/6)
VIRAGLAALAGVAALAGLVVPAASAARPEPPQVDARAWTVVEAGEGDMLAGHDASAELSIASATKLMTAYVSMRELRLSKQVTAPPYTAAGPESLLGLEAGERISVRDLIYGLILASANDGAVALAEATSGSVERFVEEMNRTAAALGLADTSYANPIGLDAPDNHSSARDLATLARRLLDKRVFRKVADTESKTIETDRAVHKVETRNELLGEVGWLNGVKTGYTLDAGYVLVGSGTRKGVTVISVVLGAPSEAARDADTLELLRWGFSLFSRHRPVENGKPLARPAVDSGGTLALVPKRDFEVTTRQGERIETRVDAPEEIDGPIRRGERLGEVSVLVDGRLAGRVPLLAAKSAPAASLPEKVEERLGVPIGVVAAAIFAVVILIAAVVIRRARRARSAQGGAARG